MAQAEHVAETAAGELFSFVDRPDASPEDLSLFGALHLVLALISARENDRPGAKRNLDIARDVAARIGADRNDFNTEFGPTNVALHALALAIDVGDAREALDIAADIDPSGLSSEWQARFWLDVAHAHTQRRQVGDAVAAIQTALDLAPEQIAGHWMTRETVALLVQLSGKRQSPMLTELAQRVATDL